MYISHNWLKALLPEMKQGAQEVADVLTRHSFETVVAGRLEVPAEVVVVRIEKVAKHPNADRLQLATITDGTQTYTVVCGAPNIAAGQVVPYAPPGAVLVDEEGAEFTVKTATIRGQESPGMLNSLRELGLHPSDHGGIWILPEDLPLGSKLAEHFPTDIVLDADITPDRAHDCLSHLGVARELAVLLRLPSPELELASLDAPAGDVSVVVEDDTDTPRYIAVQLSGASQGPSPMWLQARLLGAGGKPKNNLVDATNYVMFEVGNPTHLFDQEKLPSKTITARRGKEGENITALDENVYPLTSNDLVIASGDTPVAIAGVMGGMDSSVGETTTDILLEVATFRAYSIQETSRLLGLRSESSARFSKGLHPEVAHLAAQRAVQVLQDIAGVQVQSVVDSNTATQAHHVISFRPGRVSQIAGIEIDADEAADILQRLRCEVDDTNEVWEVAVPYDRLDLEGEHNLVEEVVRVYGLDNIPATASEVKPLPIPGEQALRNRLRDDLVALGLTETLNYSYELEMYAQMLQLDVLPHLHLANPPAPEMASLRVSLLPGLLASLVTNRDVFQKQVGRKEASLFEIGNVYKPGDGGRVPGSIEHTYVAGVVVGGVPTVDQVMQAIADGYGVEKEVVEQVRVTPHIPEDLQKRIKYRVPFVAFEFDLTSLMLHAGEKMGNASERTILEQAAVQFVPYSKYPSVMRDVSLLVDPVVSVERAQQLIERVGGNMVVDVDLFDEVEFKDSGKKSLAFHVIYQVDDRTLTDAEVAELHEKVTAALVEELNAEIR